MNDLCFARKAQRAPRLESDFQNPLVLCLLRVMFDNPKDGDTQSLEEADIKWEGPDYAPKEFAAYLRISVYSIYKWLDPDATANFPVSAFFEFLAFVRAKSGGTDHRLVDYIADISGYAERVRKIIAAVEGR